VVIAFAQLQNLPEIDDAIVVRLFPSSNSTSILWVNGGTLISRGFSRITSQRDSRVSRRFASKTIRSANRNCGGFEQYVETKTEKRKRTAKAPSATQTRINTADCGLLNENNKNKLSVDKALTATTWRVRSMRNFFSSPKRNISVIIIDISNDATANTFPELSDRRNLAYWTVYYLLIIMYIFHFDTTIRLILQQ